jgi:hypothetical protein
VPCHVFRAFGLSVEADFRLAGIPAADGAERRPRVSVRLVERAELERAWSGGDSAPVWETVMGDGTSFVHEIGAAGDHRFLYGADAFHLSNDAGTILCAPADPEDAAWRRQLLDTILFSAAFANGLELLHAAAVETDDGVVAFVAGTGAGKSSLAAELVRRGLPLFCDDVLALAVGPEGLLCFPAPPVMSLPGASGAVAGRVIAGFPREGELWLAPERFAASPRPPAAIYVLDREAGGIDEVAPTVLDLLPHAISLPHDSARARSRFALFSELAQQVPLRRLHVDADDPAALADRVEASLGRALTGASA